MKKVLVVLIALIVGVSLAFAQAAPAAEKPAKKEAPKLDRIHGVVMSINKDTSTLNVKQNKTGIIRQIVYSDATKFTDHENKPGASLDQIKEGTRIIALGKFNEKSQLAATQISIRLPK